MSDNLKSLLSAETGAAEIIEKARREAQMERNAIPSALKELEERYESALAAAKEREIAGLMTDTEAYQIELRRTTDELAELLIDKSRKLPSEALGLLRGRILKGR